MKITLQHDGKKPTKEEMLIDDGIDRLDQEFALDDSAFDVMGWISVEVGGVSVAEIHINDLYPAAIAFKERYEQQQ